jgi:hypothetical protein
MGAAWERHDMCELAFKIFIWLTFVLIKVKLFLDVSNDKEVIFLISNFRRVLNVVFFLLDYSPASVV